MKIRIVVSDKNVSVDGRVIDMPELDWSAFDGDPSTPWDDIAAVQYDAGLGQGHVEYRDIITGQATRNNIRPPDWGINSAQFNELFGWVLPLHAARKAEMDAEKARAEAELQERIAAEQAAREAVRTRGDNGPVNPGATPAVIDPADLETALAERDAKLQEALAKIDELQNRMAQQEQFTTNLVAETGALDKEAGA